MSDYSSNKIPRGNSAGNYVFKVNNRTRFEICSKLIIKTPE